MESHIRRIALFAPAHERPVGGHKPGEHGGDEFGGFGGLSAFFAQRLGIGGEIAVDGSGQVNGHPHRLFIDDCAEFELRNGQSPSDPSTKSRTTITRTGVPGRMVMVGGTSSWRLTICWPA
jgi:hypothetical protein